MRIRPMIASLLLAAYLPACTSYQATTHPLASLTAEPEPVPQVIVTTADSSRTKVKAPRVVGDTLHGYTKVHKSDTNWVAIPLSEVRKTEVRKGDALATAFLVVPIVAVIVVGGYFALWELGGGND